MDSDNMKILTFIAGAVIGVALAAGVSTYIKTPTKESVFGAQPAFTTFQGGTGSTSPSGLLYGDSSIRLKTVTFSGASFSTTTGILTVTASGGSGTVSTSTNEIAGRLAYWTSNSGTPALLGQVATGTVSAGVGVSLDNSTRSVIGGSLQITNSSPLSGLTANYPFSFSNPTLTWLGLGTTTNSGMAAGNLYVGSGGIFQTSATGTVAASGLVSVTAGNSVLGPGATISLSNINANTVVGNLTASAAAPTSFSTTSLFAAGTPGQVLALDASGNWRPFSTTTFVAGSGISLSTAGNALTITGTAGGSFPFAADTNYGQVVYSTTTPTLWFKGGVFASSTSHFVNADFTAATSTSLVVGSSTDITATNPSNINLGNFVSVREGSVGNLAVIAQYGASANGVGVNAFSARGSSLAPSASQVSDILYLMGGRGFGSTIWNTGSKVAIVFRAAETFTDTANGTYITLETTPLQSNARAERVRIDSTGNVGIGTTTPFAQLQIATTTGRNLLLTDTGAGTNLKHWLLSSDGGDFYLGTTSDLLATSSQAQITVKSGGLVGIASSSPWGTLSVNPTANKASTSPDFVVGSSTRTSFAVMNAFNGARVLIGTSTIAVANPATLTVDSGTSASQEGLLVTGSVNDFYEMNVQNRNTGTLAQGCITATRNDGTPTTGFLSGCINSTGFNNPQTYNVGNQGDANILSLANDLWIAQGTAGKKTYHTNGGVSTSTIVQTFSVLNTGFGSTSPWAKLSIHGNFGETNIPLFVVASSSLSATTTLFQIDNRGQLVNSSQASTTLPALRGVIAPYGLPPSFFMSSSTWGVGTTTIWLEQVIAPITYNGIMCSTDAGTLQTNVYSTSTASGTSGATTVNASTTNNFNLYAQNNSFTYGAKVKIDIGTAASAPTKINCTFIKTLTPQ